MLGVGSVPEALASCVSEVKIYIDCVRFALAVQYEHAVIAHRVGQVEELTSALQLEIIAGGESDEHGATHDAGVRM